MPETTPFRFPESSCRKKFTSDSWRLKHITVHPPEHLQVVRQKNLTSRSLPRQVEPAQHWEFNANKDSVEDLDAFPYLEHVEIITPSESQLPPPALPRTEINPGTGALLFDHNAEPWEHDAQGCLEMNLKDNPYYLFATHEEYKYMQCSIKKRGTKTCYDTRLKEENTGLRFRSFRNGDSVQMLAVIMPDDHALGEWELHTPDDMRWNDNHQQPIKYWSRDIIKCMRWLMWQPAYTEHLSYTPQHCFNSDTPPKRLYTEMHTADWWWETQVRRYDPG